MSAPDTSTADAETLAQMAAYDGKHVTAATLRALAAARDAAVADAARRLVEADKLRGLIAFERREYRKDEIAHETQLAALRAEVEALREALERLLDHVDYTNGACGAAEAIGGALPVLVINIARAALKGPPT